MLFLGPVQEKRWSQKPLVLGITIEARTNHNRESLINKLLGKTQGRGAVRGVLPWSTSFLPVQMVSLHIPRLGHSAAQLLTHVFTSRPSCSKHTLLLSLQISWYCWVILPLPHFSHKSLTCLFLYLLDWKHLITLSPAPSKLPATEWWALDVELELGNNITPGFVNPRTVTNIPHRFILAQHADI